MSVNINGSTGVSLVQDGVIVTADMASSVPLGTKNKIINGNLGINQRAVTGSVVLAAGVYGHDRWKAGASGCSYTFATTANVTTITISAGSLLQVIEGLNLQSGTHTLSWTGTATAKIDAGSYSASGVTGTATGGTNMTIDFSTGTLSLVQLEEGSTATPFEHRSYGQELALCQRYYQQYGSSGTTTAIGAGVWFSTTQVLALFPFIREMRTAPTMTVSGANWCMLYRVGALSVSNDTTPFDSIGATSARINNNGVVVAGVAGQGCFIQIQVGYFAYLNAEL